MNDLKLALYPKTYITLRKELPGLVMNVAWTRQIYLQEERAEFVEKKRMIVVSLEQQLLYDAHFHTVLKAVVTLLLVSQE
uniref:Uncharacterized protein n=1 Tax=Lepeophtheirus salmonis TaxID=72036 RepID=A0A0K2T1Z4_LEPSM